MSSATTASEEEARALLDKVRAFSDSLTPTERQLFAVIIGPGIESLVGFGSLDPDDDVDGFGMVTWEPESLRGRLAAAVEEKEWRIVERQD